MNLRFGKKLTEDRKLAKKGFFLEQLKPKLKEIFDSVDRAGTSTISTSEIRDAFQLMSFEMTPQMLESMEDVLTSSKDMFTRGEYTFEEFTNICFHLLDQTDLQQMIKDYPVMDFIDPDLFVYMPDNKIVPKKLSSKILDESVIIRKRIEAKYGINERQNIKILKAIEDECAKTYADSPYLSSFLKYSNSLGDCWEWLSKCLEHRKISNDFTQGLANILSRLYENNTSHTQHAEKIVMTSYIVYTNGERSEAINLLGWSYIDYFSKITNPKLNEFVRNIEKEEHYTRAAAICIFHFDFTRAFQCLANVESTNNEISFLKSILQLLKDWHASILQDREIQQMMVFDTSRYHDEFDDKNSQTEDFSNEIVALRNKPQPAKYDAMKKELKFIKSLCQHLNPTDPYFRAICKFISYSEPLSNIIKDHDLSFMDRLAFAYRFLGPKTLQNYLQETIQEAKEKGYLEALFLVGMGTEGFDIIQSYIDHTGDIQSVALLGVYFRLLKSPNEDFYKNLLINYKHLMNKLGYFEDRINLEKAIMTVEKSFTGDSQKDRKDKEKEKSQKEQNISYTATQRCYYCTKALAHPILLDQLMDNRKTLAQMHNYEKPRINFCPTCLKPLPNCAICLLPVAVLNPYIELQERIKKVPSKKEGIPVDPEEALIWCQQCKHGGHFGHIDEWFQSHSKCPVSGCECECLQNDY